MTFLILLPELLNILRGNDIFRSTELLYSTRQKLRFSMGLSSQLTTQSMGCCLTLLFSSRMVSTRIRFLRFRVLDPVAQFIFRLVESKTRIEVQDVTNLIPYDLSCWT